MKLKRLFITPHTSLLPSLSFLLTLLLVLAFAGIAHAADTLYVSPQNVQIVPGESVTLSVELDNETTNLMGWQCDILLPEGLSLALKNNGKPAAMLGSRFATTEHTISSNRLSNGAYRFIAMSIDGEAIPDTTGTLFTVTLQLDSLPDPSLLVDSVPDSLLQVDSVPLSPLIPSLSSLLTNIEFNTQDNQKLTFPDVIIPVTIPVIIGQKCATPTIAYDKGQLLFSCETEDVTFVTEVKVSDAKTAEGQSLQLTTTYEINVYATKEGYDNSDVATATIQWRDGMPLFEGFSGVIINMSQICDVNGDGQVDVADIANVIDTMAGK